MDFRSTLGRPLLVYQPDVLQSCRGLGGLGYAVYGYVFYADIWAIWMYEDEGCNIQHSRIARRTAICVFTHTLPKWTPRELTPFHPNVVNFPPASLLNERSPASGSIKRVGKVPPFLHLVIYHFFPKKIPSLFWLLVIDQLAEMYELVRDRHLRNLSYTVEYYDDDDLDYDYEVHLFWPSTRSHLDVSWDSVDVFEAGDMSSAYICRSYCSQLPSIPESQLDYQFRHAGSFLPVRTPYDHSP